MEGKTVERNAGDQLAIDEKFDERVTQFDTKNERES